MSRRQHRGAVHELPVIPVVGFFLHRTEGSGCGDVAFWCTVHPRVGQLATVHDREVNGNTIPQQDLFAQMASTRRADGLLLAELPREPEFVRCLRCGRWFTLHLKHYRALPLAATREAITASRTRKILIPEE